MEIKCPHCYESVPYGAQVCKGCQAEIEYGTPDAIAILVLLISVSVGLGLGYGMQNLYLGIALGIFSLIILSKLVIKIFKNRVKFRRAYKT